MCAISIFTTGNLLCGFAKNFEQLIVFRVWAGLGGGGINVLVLIIMSDIVSLKERGKVSSESVVRYLMIVSSFCGSRSGARRGSRSVVGGFIHRESNGTTPPKDLYLIW